MPKIRLDPSACFLGAILLLILPLKWLFAALLAAAVHELCHMAAIRLTGGEIWEVRIRGGGAVIETAPMTPGRELLCSLAGPAGGLGLLFFARWIPCTAVCALVQSLYNLLPFFPLDGGRALRCGLEWILGVQAGDKVSRIVTCGAGVVLLLLAIYGSVAWNLGMIPLLWSLFALLRSGLRKIPCKTGRFGLQ